jgi:capsular polysaccharide biosynthesis protein
MSSYQTELTDKPMSQDLTALRDVLLVPWGLNEAPGAKRAAGLFSAEGHYLPQAECLRYEDSSVTLQPEFDPAEPVETLPGRYLYGGMIYGHFGHFLCESTGRLWALAKDHGFDGVVWLPKVEMVHPARLTKPYGPFFAAMGLKHLGLEAPQKNTRIEEIVIPEQGFGIGTLSSGRPEYRSFMRANLGAEIAANGPEKLYISRSALNVKRGSVLLETEIETRLASEGYEIFHPQDQAIEVQISRYKAARQIVALDGSALHLAAMLIDPACKVAIINRGPSQNIDDYMRQFEAFAGVLPTRIDAVQSYWFPEGRRVVKRETHALLDFKTLGKALGAEGFRKKTAWKAADPQQIAAEIAEREARAEISFARYEAEAA